MHPHLEEIADYLARVRSELASVVDHSTAAEFDRAPSNGGWSGTGIIQHLGKVEGSSAKLLEGLFEKALADGIAEEKSAQSWLHSLDSYAVTNRTRRVAAPERVTPDPAASFAGSWSSLKAARERLLRAVATVDGRDLAAVSAPHPVFGALNAYQWVLIIGQHEERHLSQLRETLSEG
jgi:hypothetical protein